MNRDIGLLNAIQTYFDALYACDLVLFDKQEREDEIIMIDWLSPAAATVKVRLRIHANVFVDHLCFVRGVDGWRIVAKVWHLESARAPS